LNELYVSLAAVGGLLLLLGVLRGILEERTPVSEPLIALIAGVLIGPAALGLLVLSGTLQVCVIRSAKPLHQPL